MVNKWTGNAIIMYILKFFSKQTGENSVFTTFKKRRNQIDHFLIEISSQNQINML